MIPLQSPADLIARYADTIVPLAEFAVGAVVLYVLGRLLVEPAVHALLSYRDVERTLARGLEQVIHAGVVAVAVIVAAAVAGFEHLLGGSAVIVAAATVAVGFAARDVIGNLISGIFIVTDRTFNIGDWIEWDGNRGVIDDITFRATRVRTFDNEIVTVPNSTLVTTAVTNAVISDQLRIAHGVEVGYDDDVDEAMAILRREADEHPDVLDDPAPTVRLEEFGGAGVVLTARYWIANPSRADVSRVRSEYNRAVKGALEEREIELSPADQRELSGSLALREGGRGR